MSQKIPEMKENDLLSQWINQAQVDIKVLNRVKSFTERAAGILKGSEEFYANSKELMSPEEIRRYLKYIVQLKDLMSTGNEILDNMEKLHRSYKMRLTR